VPINKTILAKKLDFLNENLAKIENMDFAEDEFVGQADIHDLLTFRLQQSVETCIDVAVHVIAELNLPRKETAKDAFLLLGEQNIISRDLGLKDNTDVTTKGESISPINLSHLTYEQLKELADSGTDSQGSED